MNNQKLAKIIGDIAWCKGFLEVNNMPNVAQKLQDCMDSLEEELEETPYKR